MSARIHSDQSSRLHRELAVLFCYFVLTTQLSSGGGQMSNDPRKTYMLPPSSAAPGSACLCCYRRMTTRYDSPPSLRTVHDTLYRGGPETTNS